MIVLASTRYMYYKLHIRVRYSVAAAPSTQVSTAPVHRHTTYDCILFNIMVL